MATNITTSTDVGVSQRTTTLAALEMLKATMPVEILRKTGTPYQMPKNKGVNVTFRRRRVFDAVTTPLAEGRTPTASKFRYDDVPATLTQYGMVVEMTDVIEDTHEDPVRKDAAEEVGNNLGRTNEALDYGVLRAGTNVFYSNGTTRNAINTVITREQQDLVVRSLKAEKALKINKIIGSSPNFNTSPVWAAYTAVGHTSLQQDLEAMRGWVPVANYPSDRFRICDEEIGTCGDVRYLLSPDLEAWPDAGGLANANTTVSTTGTNADVYPILYFGMHAWHYVALRGQGAVEPTIIPVGQRTKSDPLGQRGYIGWKSWWAAVITNELWMARLECAVSRLN